MSNKGLLIITLVLILISLVTTVLEFSLHDPDIVSKVADGSYLLATLLGGYLLIANSDIKSTIWWRVMKFAIGVLILGVLFKVLHFTGADELLLIGCVGIAIAYLIRFITKRAKNHLDVLKMLTVLSYCIVSPLIILHYVTGEYSVISKAFFWATIVDFAYLEWRKSAVTTQRK
jgi:hypothetical protein